MRICLKLASVDAKFGNKGWIAALRALGFSSTKRNLAWPITKHASSSFINEYYNCNVTMVQIQNLFAIYGTIKYHGIVAEYVQVPVRNNKANAWPIIRSCEKMGRLKKLSIITYAIKVHMMHLRYVPSYDDHSVVFVYLIRMSAPCNRRIHTRK